MNKEKSKIEVVAACLLDEDGNVILKGDSFEIDWSDRNQEDAEEVNEILCGFSKNIFFNLSRAIADRARKRGIQRKKKNNSAFSPPDGKKKTLEG